MNPSPEELEPILVELDLAPARYVTRMQGGSAPVYQVDLADGGRLVLKAFDRDQQLSGLIDFGNMRADRAPMGLAKTIYCTEHDTPGSTAAILEGYGPIDHPEPDKARGRSTRRCTGSRCGTGCGRLASCPRPMRPATSSSPCGQPRRPTETRRTGGD